MAEDEDLWTYFAGISAKRCDVLLHPLQSNTLVMQAKVEDTSFHRLRSLREAERAKTIVDRHVQDRCPLCVTSSIRGWMTCECAMGYVHELWTVRREEFHHRGRRRHL